MSPEGKASSIWCTSRRYEGVSEDRIYALAHEAAQGRLDANWSQLCWVIWVLLKAEEVGVGRVALGNLSDATLEDKVDEALQVSMIDLRNIQGGQIDE